MEGGYCVCFVRGVQHGARERDRLREERAVRDNEIVLLKKKIAALRAGGGVDSPTVGDAAAPDPFAQAH